MISADVPLQPIAREDSTSLFSLLENRDEETFCQRCLENRGHLDKDNGEYTYLQLACFYGLPKTVEALLANDADPNLTGRPGQCSPIIMAGQQGWFNSVEKIAQHNKVNYKSTIKGTVLHAVVEGMSKARDRQDSNFVMEKYVDCIRLLLEKCSSNSLDINARNEDGFTALHLAVQLQEKRIISLLLEHGAYTGSKCNRGYAAISLMNADVFEEFLNTCIRTNDKLPIDEDYKIIYDYSFLAPPRTDCDKLEFDQGNQVQLLETELLIEISRVPELRHLLKHPVLASFVHMKWFTVRKYFWINFTFYLTFWLCLTLHTLARYSPHERKEGELGEELAWWTLLPSRKESVAWWTWFPSIFLCSLLGLREFLKFFVLPTRYIFNMENLLVLALLTLNFLVLFFEVGAGVAAVSLLLTWTEMVLLINCHPLSSSNIEMYKKVCISFLKLLAWWSMLIVAFALSFYLLFKDPENSKCTQNDNLMEKTNHTKNNSKNPEFFKHRRTAFFKAVLMMTGELEASTIPFECYPGFSHVIVILFVFLITIVLFNLMNGLAVSDTQAIRNDAEIVAYATLAKRIASIEKMVSSLETFDSLLCCVKANPIKKRRSRRPGCKMIGVLHKKFIMFPHIPHELSAHVLPNQSNKVIFSNHLGQKQAGSSFSLILGYDKYNWWIPSEIINETKKILQERKSRSEENEHSTSSLLDRRLNLLEETMNKILNTVIELSRQ